MVAVPSPFFVTVILLPSTETVAILVLLDFAVIAPSPARVTVIVPVVLLASMVRVVGLRLREPAAFPIFHVTFTVSAVPSGQQ